MPGPRVPPWNGVVFIVARSATSAIGLGLRILWWPLPVLMLAALVLGARLAAGPVNVPVPERALAALMARAAPGWRMETSGAEFDLFGQDGLTGLKLRDVRLSDAEGVEVAAVPELGLTMTLALSDTAREAVAVHGVRISGARIDVTREADDRIVFGVGGLSRPVSGGESVSLDALFDDGSLAHLPLVTLTDMRVVYRDAARGTALTAHGSTVVVDPKGSIRLDGRLQSEPGPPMPLTIDATRLPDGTIAVDATFEALDPQVIATLDPALAPLSAVTMTLDGTARVAVTAEGAVTAATAGLTAAAGGTVMVAGQPRPVERLALDLTYSPGDLRADIHDIAFDDAGLAVAGKAHLHRDGTGIWAVSAETPRLAYAAPDGTATLATGPVTLEARVEGGQVLVKGMEIAAPVLRLPRGKAVARMASLALSGSIDPETGAADLTRIDARGIALDRPGQQARARRLQATATVAEDVARLRRIVLDGVTATGAGARVALDKATGTLRVDLAEGTARTDALVLRDLHVALPEGRAVALPELVARGSVDPGRGRAALGSLRVPRARVTLPRLYAVPVPVAALDLALDIDGPTLALPRLAAQVGGVAVEGKATVVRTGADRRVTLSLTGGPTDFARILPLWPADIAAGGRRWAAKSVQGGTVGDIALDARFDTADPAGDALALGFDFADASVIAIPGMPPVQRGRGRGQVSLDRLDIVVEAGHVAVPRTAGYALTTSRFSIPDLGPKTPAAQVALGIDGSAQAVLGFLDLPPLALISKTGFDIARARGKVTGKVQVTLPLSSGMKIGDVDFRAKADIRDFALYEPHSGVRITGDTMAVAVAPDGLKFHSDARVDGLSARIRYEQGFEAPAPGDPESVLTLQSYLTREDFAQRAGIDVGAYFDGVAVLDTRVDLFPGGGARFAANADLTGSTLRIDRLGWVKPDSAPVTVTLRGFRNPDGAGQVERIVVRGSGVSATGRVGFGADGAVDVADFDRVVLGTLVDAGLHYRRGGAGTGRKIEIAGASLDLRRVFADAMEANGAPRQVIHAASGPLTEIALRLDTVRLREDAVIDAMSGGLRLRGERIEAAKVDGRLNGVAPALLLAERRDDGLAIQLTAPDAGAFLGAASVFEGATGGALRLDARLRDTTLPSRLTGTVRADGITIRNSRTMRQILSGGPASALARQMLSGGGLTFTRVKLPFSGTGGRWSIDEGVAWGNALGLTLDGTYDIARTGIDLKGTISPAYAINGALGSIPLLGGLLTGGEGQGVFGITFAVTGTTARPNVWVNPLSALAPGFLRKIVSGVMDGNTASAGGYPGGAGRDR